MKTVRFYLIGFTLSLVLTVSQQAFAQMTTNSGLFNNVLGPLE